MSAWRSTSKKNLAIGLMSSVCRALDSWSAEVLDKWTKPRQECAKDPECAQSVWSVMTHTMWNCPAWHLRGRQQDVFIFSQQDRESVQNDSVQAHDEKMQKLRQIWLKMSMLLWEGKIGEGTLWQCGRAWEPLELESHLQNLEKVEDWLTWRYRCHGSRVAWRVG